MCTCCRCWVYVFCMALPSTAPHDTPPHNPPPPHNTSPHNIHHLTTHTTSQHTPPHNTPHSHLTRANLSASNNACWSLGELAIKVSSDDLQPVVAPLAERLVPVLAAPAGSMPRSIIENSAITLGRIAWTCPEPLAGALEHFVWHWCHALRSIRDDLEKEHAFLGLCRLLRLNPQVWFLGVGSGCIGWFLDGGDGIGGGTVG